jgi:hypothetical protein
MNKWVLFASLLSISSGVTAQEELEREPPEAYQIYEVEPSLSGSQPKAQDIEKDDGRMYTVEPDGFEVIQLKTTQTAIEKSYSSTVLDQHALRVSANCNPSDLTNDIKAAVVPLDDNIYVIPIQKNSLPPFPANGGKSGIHGVDVNKNCVRDDIEHYVFRQFPRKDQQLIRRYMYEYSIWLNFFLLQPISEQTARAVARQKIKVSLCLDKILKTDKQQKNLFAEFHNTNARTYSYFDNLEHLNGWVLNGTTPSSC